MLDTFSVLNEAYLLNLIMENWMESDQFLGTSVTTC
jgi:hypothetical protein